MVCETRERGPGSVQPLTLYIQLNLYVSHLSQKVDLTLNASNYPTMEHPATSLRLQTLTQRGEVTSTHLTMQVALF